MSLCLNCGLIENHASGCANAPTTGHGPPPDKLERVRNAMTRAEALRKNCEDLASTSPRRAFLGLLSAGALLEQYTSRELVAFDEKRHHNELATRITKEREELLKELSSTGERPILEEAGFIKKALELFFNLVCARMATAEFDGTPLATMPNPIRSASEPPVNLPAVCAEVEARIAESGNLDAEVRSWTWVNLRNLMTSREPKEIPQDRVGSSVTGVLGALVGRGNTTRRLSAIGDFKRLGDLFRERLYLIAANGILLRVRSRLAQAEESWKRHLGGGGLTRWEHVQREGFDIIEYYLGSPPTPSVETAFTEAARGAGRLSVTGIRSFADIEPDEWDVFAKAYFFELTALMDDLSSRDVALSNVAPALIERKPGVPVDTPFLAMVLKTVREAWHARPPRN
jgi:hypothetical protein